MWPVDETKRAELQVRQSREYHREMRQIRVSRNSGDEIFERHK
jgi:hypothetical protein